MANRVLLGKRGTSDYGLYVSRPTEDVTSTSSGLIFDTNNAQKGFNVVAKGQGILNNNATRTFSHGLGFRPFVEVTYTNEANMVGAPPTTAATFSVTLTYNAFFGFYIVTSISVTSGGSGYTSAPVLSFSGSNQVSSASATATVSGGAVTSVTVTGGGYYTTSTAPTCTPTGGGAPAYATKVYKAYNGDTRPYASLGGGGGHNVFEDNYELVQAPQQGDEEWDLEYDEGVYYQTTTSVLTITNICNGGSYVEVTGGSTTHNSSYSGQTIYYSYIIFNCESPFV
jgi:hypothetical protein